VLAGTILDDDGFNALQVEQVGEQEAGWAGTHDADASVDSVRHADSILVREECPQDWGHSRPKACATMRYDLIND
jgi:hypothetical protein